ncbi:glycosyl hydrolase family 28-related protein [Cohnella yongneupensis]|uniref:Glycosyl hydrolase family 28-related protein n=1 Tax=Cohnella yongneupensis TaxID=425006 RepID=A0ABW0R015_9BACL
MNRRGNWFGKRMLSVYLGVVVLLVAGAIIYAATSGGDSKGAIPADASASPEATLAVDMPTPVPAPANEASITLGKKPEGRNITARAGDNPDGLVTGEQDGKTYWQTNKQADGDRTLYLYMNVDDKFLFDNKDLDVEIEVEYFDQGNGTITLQYDSQEEAAAFKDAALFPYKDSGKWKTTTFLLSDAKFANRANGDDFRLGVEGAGAAADNPEIKIASVTVRKLPKINSEAQMKVVKADYPTEDVVIADFNVTDFGAVGDGVADDTEAVQKALDAARGNGGGVVFLPSGTYKITASLFVPTGVTLRGDRDYGWTGGKVEGTILAAYANKGEEDADSLLMMQQASGVTNLSIWYPEQKIDQPIPYPWSFEQMSGDSMTVENVTLVNAYSGVKIGPDWNELHYVKNLYGTVLKTGVFLDFTTDIGRLEGIDLSPDYWANSGLPGAPAQEAVFAYTTANTEGVVMGRSDWEYMSDIRLSGFKTGMRVTMRTGKGETANAQFYRIHIDKSNIALKVEGVNDFGLLISDSSFKADVGDNPTAIYGALTFRSIVQFNSVEVGGNPMNAVVNEGSGVFSFENSTISNWNDAAGGKGMLVNNGSLILGGTTFAKPTGQVKLGIALKNLKALNSGNGGKLDVDDQSAAAKLDVVQDAAYALKQLPKVGETDIAKRPRPANDLLFNVAEAPYSADKSGNADVSAAVKKALEDAGVAGGGTVYFPAGKYRIEQPITVPSGVEIRGSWDVPHHTIGGGSVLFTNVGENDAAGTPFITLEAGAGIRGINVYYDKQDWKTIKPFAWTIRGMGHGVYAIDTTLVNSYQGIDFGTNDTSGHYIDYVAGSPLKEGIYLGGGANGGFMRNVQFNPHYAARNNYPNHPGDGDFERIWAYQKENLDAFRIENVKNETIFNTFVYGSLYGIHFAAGKDGQAPEAIIIGHGTDGSKKSVSIDGAGPAGLNFINTELVSMSSTDKVYITVGDQFNSEATMFNTSMWGDPSRGIDVKAGKFTMQQGNFVAIGIRGVNAIGGEASLYDSYFLNPGTHFYAGDGVGKATVSNNLSKNGIVIDDSSKPGALIGTDLPKKQ